MGSDGQVMCSEAPGKIRSSPRTIRAGATLRWRQYMENKIKDFLRVEHDLGTGPIRFDWCGTTNLVTVDFSLWDGRPRNEYIHIDERGPYRLNNIAPSLHGKMRAYPQRYGNRAEGEMNGDRGVLPKDLDLHHPIVKAP